MKASIFCLATAIASFAATGFAVVVETQDFTPAQLGNLPAGWSASFDPDSDVEVVAIGTMSPPTGGDHSGGDGHCLRVGDLGASGGGFNYAYNTGQSPIQNSKVTAWVYVSYTSATLERDYILSTRNLSVNPMTAPARQGYSFMISEGNATWPGLSPNPANQRPYLVVRKPDTNYYYVGTQAVNPVAAGWHLLAIEANGSTITGYVDGVAVCTGTDTTFSTGFSAIGYYDDNNGTPTFPYAAAYDNYVLESFVPASVSDWQLLN